MCLYFPNISVILFRLANVLHHWTDLQLTDQSLSPGYHVIASHMTSQHLLKIVIKCTQETSAKCCYYWKDLTTCIDMSIICVPLITRRCLNRVHMVGLGACLIGKG